MLHFNTARDADYYMRGEFVGEAPEVRIGGKLNKILGRDGFTEESFRQLMAGQNPNGGKLTQRLSKNRTHATDVTANVSKEIAAIIEVAGDGRAKEVLWESWDDTMRHIERQVYSRIRVDGKQTNRKTGNIAYDGIFHSCTRPTKEDGKSDPHPHIHGIIYNATYDREEKKIKAVKLDFLDKSEVERYFHKKLAKGLREIGYDARVVKAEKLYEGHRPGTTVRLKGVDQAIVDTFSRRNAEVEEDAGRRGYTGKAKATLSQSTRMERVATHTRAEVRDYWSSRITQSQSADLRKLVAKSKGSLLRQKVRDSIRRHLTRVRGHDNEVQHERGIER